MKALLKQTETLWLKTLVCNRYATSAAYLDVRVAEPKKLWATVYHQRAMKRLVDLMGNARDRARDTAYAIVFGPGTLLDAWFIAFRIPNLGRRLFGEGAASASVIPVYSEQLNANPQQAGRLARTVISVIFLVLMGLVLIGEIITLSLYWFWGDNVESKLIFALTAVTLPYMVLICLVAIAAGLLNVH